jgi:phytoene dehydrogenase-like protein
MSRETDVLIVGAGLAGLCCARRLHLEGVPYEIFEAGDGVGGRVRTDQVEGFLLDRGFQVFAAAYPEAQRVLDYDALELQSFYPGAVVRFGDGFHRVADPWRRPLDAATGIFSPVGSLADKLRVGTLRHRARAGTLEELFSRPEETALHSLRHRGFSDRMIDRFFRPFFGGVFLEDELATSSRMLEFVFRMFAEGPTCIPRAGMGAIPAQLAESIPDAALHLDAPVDRIEPGAITTRAGIRRTARAVVLAVEGPEAERLCGTTVESPAYLPAGAFYYAADQPPLADPVLVLDGNRTGPIQTLAVLSNVSPRYAPDGKALISVSVIGPQVTDPTTEELVRTQARSWFGPQVSGWRLIRTYRIPRALPDQRPSILAAPGRPVRLAPGLFVCGDYRDHGSIQGAMVSGRRAAEAVLEDLG